MQASTQIIDLKDHALLAISGPDALSFLQGQLTADIREITGPDKHRLAAHCNTKGRIVTLYRVFKKNDNYYLQLPRVMLSKSMESLQKYARFSKMTIQNLTESIQQIAILNTDHSVISKFASEHPNIFEELSFLYFNTGNPEESIQKFMPLNYQVIGSYENVMHYLSKNYPTLKPVPSEIWRLFEIRSNIPTVYPETSESFLPHHLNLSAHQGLSFNKGCYLGQEIIARMEHLGKIKKQMLPARIPKREGPPIILPNPGTEIFSDSTQTLHSIGKIVSIAPSSHPDLCAECLIEIPIDNVKPIYFVPIKLDHDPVEMLPLLLNN